MACACLALVLAGCTTAHRSETTSSTTGTASMPGASTTTNGSSVRGASLAWRVKVRGAVYAQPVIVGSRVFIVTEDDDVYALSLHSGAVLWHANIGAPLTAVGKHAGCGDIDPLGITSTPVADKTNGTLYVVGEISNGAARPRVRRELVGFDMKTGAVLRTADADPTGGGDSQINLQQRAGLVLDDGRVDVAFGGLYGDCGYYHGWVVGVSTTPGVANIEFDITAGGSGGAIWQGGAPPSIDAKGDLYVVTGNQNSQGTAGYYESVVKLSPRLVPEASFRDPAARGDEDFGTGTPLLLPNGTLFAVGKSDIGYLLKRSDLKLVARIPGVCGSNPDGRIAFDPTTDAAYVPCRGGGVQQVNLRNKRLGWRSGSVNSSPILAGGSLWALSYPGGTLQGLNPISGHVESSIEVGRVATFATPAEAGGLLLVGTVTGEVEALYQ